ncbi:hypothetical protein Aduo_015922 [Ancylostoma duodenale]
MTNNDRNSAKKRKETERAAFSLLDAECKIMYAQLAKLKKAPPQETSATRNEPHCVQLNRGDFDSVEYHATFDPIAAAEARKEERALAEEEGIEPILSNANQLPR